MADSDLLSYTGALTKTLAHISPLGAETVTVEQALGRITAAQLHARVDSPSADVSLKDGYAVRSADVAQASPETPVHLRLVGSVAAGGSWTGFVAPGTAVRILSGAPIPAGAQAVLAEEFAQAGDGEVVARADARPGRNILALGSDVARGQTLAGAGEMVQPGLVGLLTAAGCENVTVRRRPRVAILATGDEVVAPGKPLGEGKVYASNLATLAAWLRGLGMEGEPWVEKDNEQAITFRIQAIMAQADALLISGGAWKGDRDLAVTLLEQLGWEQVYHRVRIGPGKAVGFGLLEGKPVFCLPGGPPSNYMAFINLALPGLMKLTGFQPAHLPRLPVRLTCELRGQIDWTQFVAGKLAAQEGELWFEPMRLTSRLQELAQAQAVVAIPEGRDRLDAGERMLVTSLRIWL